MVDEPVVLEVSLVTTLENLALILGVAFLCALGLYGFYLLWARIKADWDRYEEPK
jgi:hypothetical protein